MAVKPKHIRTEIVVKAEAIRQANLLTQEPRIKGAIGLTNGRQFSTGYRMSPNPKVSHRFSIHPGREFYTHNADQILTSKQLRVKYAPSHNELYEGKTTKDHESLDCLVRVGTTKAHGLMLTDKETGEAKYIKVPAKAKWAKVGDQVTPRDGGK